MPGKVNKSSGAFIFRKGELDRDLKKLDQEIKRVLAGVEGATRAGIRKAALVVFERSQELVPRDTNALWKSGFVETVRGEKENLKAPTGIGPVFIIGYDKNNEAPHAVFVHEILENQHKPPTQAKFLQTALHENMRKIPQIVAQEVRDRMRRQSKKTRIR